MASLLKAPVAAHLHRQLVSDPLLFVTGLPASPAVEYMLSLPAENPTDSAALIHEGSYATIDLHPGRVASCRNRPALRAAANDLPTVAPDDFIPLLVTNPATPRTPHVQHLTRMADRTAVVQAFATQYTSPRRAEFNWKEHGDLLQLVESAPELGALLESASRDWQWAVDPRFPRHRLLPKTLERHTETWAFKLGPVQPDGTLRIKTPVQPETLGLRRTGRPLPRRLIKLWRRRPESLTPSEKAEGAQMHAIYAEPDPRWAAISPAPSYAAGTHMLDIHEYGWRPQGFFCSPINQLDSAMFRHCLHAIERLG